MKHLSSRRKRNRRDPPSSGERKGESPNPHSVRQQPLLCTGVGGYSREALLSFRRVKKFKLSRTVLEKQAGEGESPVDDERGPLRNNPK